MPHQVASGCAVICSGVGLLYLPCTLQLTLRLLASFARASLCIHPHVFTKFDLHCCFVIHLAPFVSSTFPMYTHHGVHRWQGGYSNTNRIACMRCLRTLAAVEPLSACATHLAAAHRHQGNPNPRNTDKLGENSIGPAFLLVPALAASSFLLLARLTATHVTKQINT